MIPVLIPDTFDLQRLYEADGKPLFDSLGRELYVPDANPSVPTHNGLGQLAEAVSCIVKSTINTPDELTMTYPITGSLFHDIKERCVIVAQPERTRSPQPYRIYRITKPMRGVITVYARHLAYDGLSGIPVAPFTASDIQGAMAGLKANAMVSCPFTLTTTRTTAAKFSVSVPTDIWSLMGGQQGSLLDVYGGEYSFSRYSVRLENRIGQDNGVKVRYGVNMVDLEQDSNIASCYTGVVAYWQGEDEEIHSPVIYAGGVYGYVRILPVDMSDRWENKPTAAQLEAAARAYITANQIGVPKVSWKVEMVDLSDTEEYKNVALLEHVSLGDTVGVEYEALGVDATARVRSIEWDVFRARYQTITLGSVKANIASTLAGQARVLEKTPTRAETISLAETISKTLTSAMLGANGGSLRMLDTNNDGDPDELYAADDPDPALARYVTRLNYRGLAVSDSGYNGPYKLGWTPEGGFMAWMITAAQLIAGKIQSADEGKTFFLNLDTGEMRIGGESIIQSSDGSFVINLASGVLTTTATVTYAASDYTQTDVDRINDILLGNVTPTDADYEKYDFYQDGEISVTDLVIARSIILSGEDKVITWSAQIEPSRRGQAFSVTMNGEVVFRAGVNMVAARNGKFDSSLSCGVLTADSGTVNGALHCNQLFVNGVEITP